MSYSGFSGYHSHSQLALLTSNSNTNVASNASTLDTHLVLNNSPNIATMNESVNEDNTLQSVSTNASLSPTSSSSVRALPSAYDSRIISSYPRLPALYSSSYPDQNSFYPSHTANPFYSSFGHPYEVKDPIGGWSALPQTMCYPYETSLYNPYGDRYSAMDSAARRKNATRETTNTLKAWLYEHRKNPYPTKGEKIMLAIITKMTLTQVSTWFANARRRLKKENKMTWEPRNKCNDKEDEDINSSDDETENKPTTIRESDQTSNICHMNASNKDQQSITSTTTHLNDCNESFKDSSSYEIKESIGDNSHSVHHHNGRDAKPLLSHQINNNSRTQLASIQHIKRESSANMLDNANNLDNIGQRPKIWSLAQTATSESPPYNGKLSTVSCNEWTSTLPLGSDGALTQLSEYPHRDCPQPSHLSANSLRKAPIGWPEDNCVTNCSSRSSTTMQLFTHESLGHTSYLHSHNAKQSVSGSFTANSHHHSHHSHHSHHTHHTFSPSIPHLVHGNHDSFSPYNNVTANNVSIRPIIDSQQTTSNFSYINENRVSNGITNGSISKSNTFLCKVFPEYISSGPDALSLADNNSERGGNGSTMSIEDSSMSSSSSPNLDIHASNGAKQTIGSNSASFSAFRPMLKR